MDDRHCRPLPEGWLIEVARVLSLIAAGGDKLEAALVFVLVDAARDRRRETLMAPLVVIEPFPCPAGLWLARLAFFGAGR